MLTRPDANTITRQHLRVLFSPGDNVDYQAICHIVKLNFQKACTLIGRPRMTTPNTQRGHDERSPLQLPYYNKWLSVVSGQ